MLLLLKGHVKGYTKKDGTFAREHDTKIVTHSAYGSLAALQQGIGKQPQQSSRGLLFSFACQVLHAGQADGIPPKCSVGRQVGRDLFPAPAHQSRAPGGFLIW